MKYQLRNIPLLKKVLWADCSLGVGTGLVGLLWYPALTEFLGLPVNLIVIVATVTLGYGLLALRLVLQRTTSILFLRILITANWVWTIISVALLIFYIQNATLFGAAFLILQEVVVAMLAYLEGRHVYSFNGGDAR
ncbi:hypothetical protein FAM09_01330 [Niastella caeni]|uniref:Uncharacterized protein n=1 Tax=Niastella caeni TaxID=2569763 RepID=A0A4S8I3J4_9BACT|nr:hypothetical protein [Niastella caeni]THU40782.1 hypothetical protein FAM09_01330 [Niastella caeni]